MRAPMFRTMLTLTAVAALAACSDSTAPDAAARDATVTADMAVSSGEAVANDLGLLGSAERDLLGAGADAPRSASLDVNRIPSGCTQQQNGSYTCTAGSSGTVTWSRTFTFYDASGAVMAGYDPALTASINFQSTVTGTASRPGHSAQFSHSRNVTLSGLAGEETSRTWNGVGEGTRSETWTGERGTRTYSIASKDTVTDVVVNLPRSANPYPASGTIVRRVEGTASFSGENGEGTRSFERRVQVTFNGTATVPLQINDRSCTLNLDTRQVSCAE